MLIMPISALLAKASLVPLQEFITRAAEPVAVSAYFVSFSMALLAGAVNAVFGFLLAWVLVKYEFPGEQQARWQEPHNRHGSRTKRCGQRWGKAARCSGF